MRYKDALEIYLEEVKNKRLFIPRLGFQDEMHFQMLNLTITELAGILNLYSRFRQFFMFDTRRQYRETEKELRDFIDFWSFDEELINQISVAKFRQDDKWDH